jgi:hypothetical protein
MTQSRKVVGIDVSKANLDCAAVPGNVLFQVRNDEAGVQELIGRYMRSVQISSCWKPPADTRRARPPQWLQPAFAPA